ncbi:MULTISPECIES: hypothetical protein [unclassified Duganella]|uniref:hypothetical protein n=1 Tax=unclassified Duganella TaxID=2636909 RepID=UPI00088983F8|nr:MULTISPECIES: hypothetical protein [unclassified Duganella]SDF79765.1 hypothetical protein SAMN05216320_1011355 [Duganella sp. OV458]SDI49349.1 hypothetical protein SAMN05428973_10160 [Duganella sp. OV510]
MNAVVELPPREVAGLTAAEMHRYSAAEIRERVNLVQEVMRAVMKEGVHYGKIPGTPKPTLYKAGAEVLCVAFRIAPSYRVEDLGGEGVARCRVTCVGTHQTTGIVLGEGVGECSSAEEKYKWRKAICTEEFDLTPETMRRLKFGKGDRGVYKVIQIRTEAADQANTVLKMASKRAHVAMTLTVTGASDMFSQDIEDMPEELRNDETGEPAVTALAEEWVARANAAPTADDLTAVWKAGVKAINEAKDATASNAFKAAVAARGEAFKAAQPAEKPAVPALSTAAGEILADMEIIAAEGVEVFQASWNGLSKATQETLAPHFDTLLARAEKSGGAP